MPPDKYSVLGAMLGGLLEAFSLQPLDVVKTRLQMSSNETLFQIVKNMATQEGLLSFYKGLTPFATHLVTKYSVRWYFNEFYRHLLTPEGKQISTSMGFLAGLGSGITEAVLIVTPFELIKTRLQQQKGTDSSTHKYKGLFQSARLITQEEGVRALWKGNVPTMLRQGINQLFLFGTYDQLKYALYHKSHHESINSHEAVLLGIIAGAMGPVVNNPVDVAKTRLMAQLVVPGQTAKYTGTLQCISKVYAEEGMKSLMRGCLMRVARVAPGMGITFMCVEKVKAYGRTQTQRARE